MEIRDVSQTIPVTRARASRRRGDDRLSAPGGKSDCRRSRVPGWLVGEDHHAGLLQVDLATEVTANVVIVRGRLGGRDWSGNWDEEYNGSTG
jgi:hypothetical protein